jgi:cation-transporting P-type ATPase E
MTQIDIMKGLTLSQVEVQKQNGLANNFIQPKGRTYSRIITENVFTFINILLAGISILLLLVGRIDDAVIYFSVALLNILVGLIQEIRAKQKLDTISHLVSPKAVVIRDGIEQKIYFQDIVQGDLVKLVAGDIIPVDGKIANGNCVVDEAILTGETDTINKNVNDELFAGTSIISGGCQFVATAVGSQSMANKINSKAKVYHRTLTPIQKEVNLVIRILFVITATLGAMVSMSAYLLKIPLSEHLQVAAVVLGIIPNSLFAMINLAYALGGVAILKEGALVQKLNAVESLSNVDVLCLDKTGTLTTKNLILEEIIEPNNQANQKEVEKTLNIFVSSVTELNATASAIANKIVPNNQQSLVAEIPFNSSYKWSGISYLNQETKQIESVILGAPEVIFGTSQANSNLQEVIKIKQDLGLRCLLLAKSNTKLDFSDQKIPKLPSDLQIHGLLIFSDQIRDRAGDALAKFMEAGITVKIISGDNPETVLALAKQINLGDDIQIISGTELDKLNDDEWSKVVETTSIFGRITPDQKEKLIQTLQKNGHYTAMIGDGVNDVMSIKTANLGIAMESGSSLTRSVADILLLKDSFISLPQGLIEGQKIRSSLENIFKLYLVKILYLVILILSVRIVGLPFPFSIKQSSLISVFATGIPAIGLAIWSHSGVRKKSSIIDSVLHFVIPAAITLSFMAIGLLFGLTVLELYHIKDSLDLIRILSISNPDISAAFARAVPQLQTTLTIFLIFAGLILNIFVAPPHKSLSLGAESKGDFRPTILSISLGLLFAIVYFTPQLAKFWGLTLLTIPQLIIVILCLVSWILILSLFWKFKLVDKFLGIKLDN